MVPITKRRILLIDDQPSIHEDYRKIICASSTANSQITEVEADLFGKTPLERESTEIYDIDSALSGEEAIALVEAALSEGRPYSVAFVDIRMPPGIDGVKTMRRIWEIDSEILAVMCSAYSDYSWEAIVSELNRTDRFLILRKPFDTMEVRQCAAALSGRWAAARSDALTGLLNRRSFNEHLRREWALAIRHNHPLSCVMIDLDHFKVINDRYGQNVGDQVLTILASILADEIRQGDVLGRYGGEEFCVLLPNMNQAAAVQWAERVRKNIASQPLSIGGHSVVVTASFGVAQRISAWQEELVEQADEALRDAKVAGRDCVLAWQSASGDANHAIDHELSELAETFGHSAPACDELQRVLKHAHLFRAVTARDLMSTPVVCVPRDASAVGAAKLLLARKLSSAPVVNADGSLAGIVFERDIIETGGVGSMLNGSVEQFMNKGVIQYSPETPAIIIFDFLCRVQIHHVVIVENTLPVGLISRDTFLKWAQNKVQRTSSPQKQDAAGSLTDEVFVPVVTAMSGQAQDVIADLSAWSCPSYTRTEV